MSAFDNPATRIGAAVFISGLFFAFIIAFILPEIPLPPEMADAIGWLFDTMWSWDFMIPFSTLMTCFGIILTMEMIFVSLKLAMWLKKHLTQQH